MDLSSLCKQNMFSNLKPQLMGFYYCDSILFWLQMCLFFQFPRHFPVTRGKHQVFPVTTKFLVTARLFLSQFIVSCWSLEPVIDFRSGTRVPVTKCFPATSQQFAARVSRQEYIPAMKSIFRSRIKFPVVDRFLHTSGIRAMGEGAGAFNSYLARRVLNSVPLKQRDYLISLLSSR